MTLPIRRSLPQPSLEILLKLNTIKWAVVCFTLPMNDGDCVPESLEVGNYGLSVAFRDLTTSVIFVFASFWQPHVLFIFSPCNGGLSSSYIVGGWYLWPFSGLLWSYHFPYICFRIILTTRGPFHLFLVPLRATVGSHFRTYSFVYTLWTHLFSTKTSFPT